MPLPFSEPTCRAWMALLRAPGIGGVRLRDLLERFGSVDTVIGAGPSAWRAAGVPAAAIAWLQAPDPARIDADLDWLGQPRHHLVTWDSEDYPALLRRSPQAPGALFVAGDPNLLWHPQIAIVGSRNPSDGGRANARDFSRTMSRSGLLVTSGLADGIDAAAHRAALDVGRPTVAVIATGPDLVYPVVNRQLSADIVEHGTIVSEFPPGTEARREHFPRRNRIIAGLCLGTLVVEAALRSGALITARLAAEAGREVFALPGSIHNPLAKGCHRLIRDGAALVESAPEIIEALGPQAAQLADALRARLAPGRMAPSVPTATPTGTGSSTGTVDLLRSQQAPDPDYVALHAALGHDPVAIDTLAERTGLTVEALSSMLLLMELDGRVTASHGRYALHRS